MKDLVSVCKGLFRWVIKTGVLRICYGVIVFYKSFNRLKNRVCASFWKLVWFLGGKAGFVW